MWQGSNHPVELDTNELITQCLEYVHENPVKAVYVREAIDYVFSSAVDYTDGKGLLKISNFGMKYLVRTRNISARVLEFKNH